MSASATQGGHNKWTCGDSSDTVTATTVTTTTVTTTTATTATVTTTTATATTVTTTTVTTTALITRSLMLVRDAGMTQNNITLLTQSIIQSDEQCKLTATDEIS